jgi:Mu transposase-like protein
VTVKTPSAREGDGVVDGFVQRQSREWGEICAGQFLAGLAFSGLGRSQHPGAGLAQHDRQSSFVHGTTGEVPFTRLRSEGLQAADKALTYDTSLLITRRSSKDCFISYSGNLYSVPAASARKTLQVKITEAEELVICSEVGQELARHRVLFGRQERSVQADHYRGLGTPVSRVEQASAMQELRPAERTMFWDAPVVEVRPLSVYDRLLGEVS